MGSRHVIIAALALALGACASSPPPRDQPPLGIGTPLQQVRCPDCGRVERIEVLQVTSDSKPTGTVLSGIVGGVASGAATDYGPAKHAARPNYRISVHMDDGRHLVFVQGAISPSLREGSTVRIDSGRVILLR
jgi:outer membrane lipoprotein SlyB